jgi:hypothetical protein
MKKQQAENWQRQQERKKAHVLQYRDQYTSEDLLPPSRVAPGGMPVDKAKNYNSEVMSRPRPGGVRSQTNRGREPVPIPDQSTSFRPSSSSNVTTGTINNRMMDRMMDNGRGPRPQGW